jgi:uncharacterized protein (TIGR03790 family)
MFPIAMAALLPAAALALGPHEVVVLVNPGSKDSVAIASRFVKLRGVPPLNVIDVDLGFVKDEAAPISPKEFEDRIWTPVTRAMRERRLDDHVLAWVYSAGFPVAIGTEPPISITGITFARGRVPDLAAVKDGMLVSPLFSGFINPDAVAHFPQTLDAFREWLGADMPVPSMMLGYTGMRGNTREAVLDCLQAGFASDGTFPTGTVYFVTGKDIRSECRQWQFPRVAKDLAAMAVDAVVTDKPPAGRTGILGVMMGAASVRPGPGNRFLPGAMAEHLTSAGAVFRSPDQTKLTAWIEAGATAPAGAVPEPFAIWTKFPHASFFTHYAWGCTMLESFYGSVRCPMQILPVGDPLASPWAPKGEVRIRGPGEEAVAGVVTITADAVSDPPHHYPRFLFLIDGRVAGREHTLTLDTTKIPNGRHTLRAVAYGAGLIRTQLYRETALVVRNP